jgi:hypothetical protein
LEQLSWWIYLFHKVDEPHKDMKKIDL